MPTHPTTNAGITVERLPGGLRQALEKHYSADLSKVRVHRQSRPSLDCRMTGRLAFTLGEDIHVCDEVYQDAILQEFILAHEVAHVLQKRKHKEGEIASSSTIELEANCAALAFVWKRPVGALSADDPETIRAFGPEGHFYTVYYVALAAGLSNDVAGRLAFSAQIADQIWELDAMDVIVDWGTKYCRLAAERAKYPGLELELAIRDWRSALFRLPPKRTKYVDPLTTWLRIYGPVAYSAMYDGTPLAPVNFIATIQRGLHCLTGGSALAETAYRRARLEAGNIAKPEIFGLHIHAFADSYAHRRRDQPASLYNTGLGHAIAAIDPTSLGDYEKMMSQLRFKLKGIYQEMVWVDNIQHRQDLYVEYGTELYEILCKKSSHPSSVTSDKVKETLLHCSATDEEELQRIRLQAASADLTKGAGFPFNWSPGGPTVSWQAWRPHGLPAFSFNDAIIIATPLARWIPLQYGIQVFFANLPDVPDVRKIF